MSMYHGCPFVAKLNFHELDEGLVVAFLFAVQANT